MVRPAVLLSGVLILGVGVALGLQVLLAGPGAGGAAGRGSAGEAGSGDPTAPADGDQVPQGHLYSGVLAEPGNLNPFTTRNSSVRTYVLGFTHEALFDQDPETGDLRGALAARWEVEPDGRAMVVELREGVQFADGTALSIDDVLFTYEVSRAPGVVMGSMADPLAMVQSVEVLSTAPPRLRIAFDRLHYAAPAMVGTAWFVANKRWFLASLARLEAAGGRAPRLDEESFGALLGQWTQSPGPGTGPYRFVDDGPLASWRKGRDITLHRSEHAWQRAARPGTWNFAGIRLQFLGADAGAYYTALVERAVDWYGTADPEGELERRPELRADYKVFVYDKPTLGAYAVQWNTRREHLADPRVRRALSMLFDRAAICAKVLGGHAQPAVAFAKPGRPDYPSDLAPDPFDPAAARRLLREAGFDAAAGRPLHVELLTVAVPTYRQIGELASDAARDAGVDLRLRAVNPRELIDIRGAGDWDGALVLMSLDPYGDPFDVLHSRGALNLMGWHDAAADQLLEQAQGTLAAGERAALHVALHRIVHAQQPITLLAHPLASLLLNRHLQRAEPGPLGLWPERFWVPRQHQRAGP